MIGSGITPGRLSGGYFSRRGINDRPPQKMRSPEPVIDAQRGF